MNIDRTMKYLCGRLEYLKELVKVNTDNKNKCEIEKKELFVQIENYKTKIDEAHDVFSPKSAKNEFVKDQIMNFEQRVKDINDNIEEIDKCLVLFNREIDEIEKIIDEINSNVKFVEENNLTKEIDCINIEKKTVDNDQIEVSKKIVRDIVYKCENCRAFMDMDVNRSKLEINTIINMLGNIINM